MAHFRGIIQGMRGAASRLGGRASGLTVEAASWEGKVTVVLYNRGGCDHALIRLERHQGHGTSRTLYEGPICGEPVTEETVSVLPSDYHAQRIQSNG